MRLQLRQIDRAQTSHVIARNAQSDSGATRRAMLHMCNPRAQPKARAPAWARGARRGQLQLRATPQLHTHAGIEHQENAEATAHGLGPHRSRSPVHRPDAINPATRAAGERPPAPHAEQQAGGAVQSSPTPAISPVTMAR